MRIARDLGYTLSELTAKMTFEEMQLWAIIYEVEAQEQEDAMRKAQATVDCNYRRCCRVCCC
jgi:hypothetical protein